MRRTVEWPSTSPTLLAELFDEKKGDDAWRAFLGRYEPMIRGRCRRLGLRSDEAEELVSAVVAHLVVELRAFEYDPKRRFRGWLKTVVTNAVLGYWRRRARRPGDYGYGFGDQPDPLWDAPAPEGTDGLALEVCEAMEQDLRDSEVITARVRARVQPRTWQAFWATAVDDEAGADVAARLGMTVAAVYVARSKVGKMLRAEADEMRCRAAGGGGAMP